MNGDDDGADTSTSGGGGSLLLAPPSDDPGERAGSTRAVGGRGAPACMRGLAARPACACGRSGRIVGAVGRGVKEAASCMHCVCWSIERDAWCSVGPRPRGGNGGMCVGRHKMYLEVRRARGWREGALSRRWIGLGPYWLLLSIHRYCFPTPLLHFFSACGGPGAGRARGAHARPLAPCGGLVGAPCCMLPCVPACRAGACVRVCVRA